MVSLLEQVQVEIAACRACPKMVGLPVHGPAVETPIFLLGQAPGPHEGKIGRPFAYTAGKTLFRWFEEGTGVREAAFRENVYMAAVARCFPGKGSSGGGDRVPDRMEIARCAAHVRRELAVLKPKLLLAIGRLAISQALGPEIFQGNARLAEVVGQKFATQFHGSWVDVICLPHPSGLSSWPKTEPGKVLLARALKLVANHSVWHSVFGI